MERCWQPGHLEKILAGYQWWLRSPELWLSAWTWGYMGQILPTMSSTSACYWLILILVWSRSQSLEYPCWKLIATQGNALNFWWLPCGEVPQYHHVISQKHHVTCPSVHPRRTDHWNQFMFFFALLHSLLDVGSYPLASVFGLVLLFEALSQVKTNLLWDPFGS